MAVMFPEINATSTRLDLRFPNKGDEEAFRSSLEEQLLSSGFLYSAIASVIMGAYTLWNFSREVGSSFVWSASDPQLCCFAALGSGALVTCGLATLLWFRIHRDYHVSWNYEALIAGAFLYYVLVLGFFGPTHGPILLGSDPIPSSRHARHRGGTEMLTFEMLSIDLVISCLAVRVPLRTCVGWIVPVFGGGAYVLLLIFVTRLDLTTTSMLVLLLFLVFFTMHTHESDKRYSWLVSIAGQQQPAVPQFPIEGLRIVRQVQEQAVLEGRQGDARRRVGPTS
eukprot:NODE_12983_length_1192_cov_10.107981.p1 GENE.NODE_12983_length_1192_cov_10.107981~~NODE_12983_length_1192_cov_10.107981.p1  ORF type:complete len:310 (-),score=61.63 NODE_12983_length_1192_cov_10.107981:261-1103(-)